MHVFTQDPERKALVHLDQHAISADMHRVFSSGPATPQIATMLATWLLLLVGMVVAGDKAGPTLKTGTVRTQL